MECYYCNSAITEINKSEEHIIPNAIGGRLKSKKLLCHDCNGKLSKLYDAKLCADLNVITSSLVIKREKGLPPEIKNIRSDSGELFHLKMGRMPTMSSPKIDINREENIVHISARTEQELRKVIKGMKRKYPNLDDENLDEKFLRTETYMKEALHMNINVGSELFLKGILKIAIGYYLHNNSNINYIQNQIEELKKEGSLSTDVIRHYYTPDSINYLSEDEVSHTVYIQGLPDIQLLYAFVEVYSSFAFVINLNTEYTGPELEYCYCYDVLENKRIKKGIEINYQGYLTGDLTLLNQEFIAALTTKLDRVMRIADKRNVKAEVAHIIRKVIKEVLRRHPNETTFTKEILDEITSSARKKLLPFFSHLRSRHVE